MKKFNDKVGEKGSAETDFSVVSYNILADCHMKPDWYDIICHDDGDGLDYVKQRLLNLAMEIEHVNSLLVYFFRLSTLIMYIY